MNIKLSDTWILWKNIKKKDWTINGYKELFKLEYLEELMYLMNNYDKLGGLNNSHFFIMKENILPIWEDKNNINGGCISFKYEINIVESKWNELCAEIIGNNFPDNFDINGISICIQNPHYSIIQIWIKNQNDNIINYISKNINSDYLYKNYKKY